MKNSTFRVRLCHENPKSIVSNDSILSDALIIGYSVFPELSEKQALAVILFLIFGKKQAASLMAISPNTIKSQLRRASICVDRKEGCNWGRLYLVSDFDLEKKTSITNFCICISFKNDDKYFLSNMPDWAIEYHRLGGKRADKVFDPHEMRSMDHFFPTKDKYDEIQNILVEKEEKEFGYFDTYSLIRKSSDAVLILLALHKSPVSEKEKIYKNSKLIFEDFCIFMISSMMKEIKLKNKKQENLRIFNDMCYLFRVVKGMFFHKSDNLTKSERIVLRMLKYNYLVKSISRYIGMTESGVRKKIESSKSKLNASTTSELMDIINSIDF